MGPKKTASSSSSKLTTTSKSAPAKTKSPGKSVSDVKAGAKPSAKDQKVVPKKGASTCKASNPPCSKTVASKSKTTILVNSPQEKLAELTIKETEKKDVNPVVECTLGEIAAVLIEDTDKKIKNSGRWPLLIDPSGNGATFLKYRYTNYLCTLNDTDMSMERLRPALIGAIRYGKPLILDMMDVSHMDVIESKLNNIQANLYKEIISQDIMKNERYLSLVRPTDDEEEYHKDNFVDMYLENFVFLIASKIVDVPQEWKDSFCIVKIV